MIGDEVYEPLAEMFGLDSLADRFKSEVIESLIHASCFFADEVVIIRNM